MSTVDPHDTPDTVVFIHGLWLTSRSWDSWASRYSSRGYRTLTPGWPGLEGEVEQLRHDPTPLVTLRLERIVDHYERLIEELSSPPIIIGHSLGGTVMQVLLDRGLGAVGVGVASATVRGVFDLPLSTLRASAPVLRNPFRRGRASPLTRSQFRYALANTLSEPESDALYDRYYVPAANRVLFQVAFANLNPRTLARVDFHNPARAPLLMVAFSDDHVVPPTPIRHNVARYRTPTRTDFREFPGRPHFPAAPGWEEVSDHVLSWATENAHAANDSNAATR